MNSYPGRKCVKLPSFPSYSDHREPDCASSSQDSQRTSDLLIEHQNSNSLRSDADIPTEHALSNKASANLYLEEPVRRTYSRISEDEVDIDKLFGYSNINKHLDNSPAHIPNSKISNKHQDDNTH